MQYRVITFSEFIDALVTMKVDRTEVLGATLVHVGSDEPVVEQLAIYDPTGRCMIVREC